jgi:hypothetical protein
MRTADGYVEILSGLRAGDLLVVRGAEGLSDGVLVRLVESKNTAAKGGTGK